MWAYYISPFAYALRAVVINEMRSPNWQQPNNASVIGGPSVGEVCTSGLLLLPACSPWYHGCFYPKADNFLPVQAALQSFEFQTETVWIWYGIAFLLGCIALLMGISILGLTWISPSHARPSAAAVNQTIAAKQASRDHDKMRHKIERRKFHDVHRDWLLAPLDLRFIVRSLIANEAAS